MTKYYLIPPHLYDDQFWWKTDDIEFWKTKLLLNPKAPILELAAGTGRIGFPLIRESSNYTGLELSEQYVDYANKKISSLSSRSKFIQGDMRDFNLNKFYKCIFIGFNSFLHLLSEYDAIRCLESIKKHMNADSILYLDLFVPNTNFLYRANKEKTNILTFQDSILKKSVDIIETLEYDFDNEVMAIKWNYLSSQKSVYPTFNFKMKLYYPDSMHKILDLCGLSIRNMWGSYDHQSFSELSDLQLYECVLK